MNNLSFSEMEEVQGGALRPWLEAGCIAGGIGMSLVSGGTLALVAALTIHACAGYIAGGITFRPGTFQPLPR